LEQSVCRDDEIASDSMLLVNNDEVSAWSCVRIISMVFPAKMQKNYVSWTLNLTLTSLTPNT